jgi:uncharacterized protein (DUF362 family)
MSVVYWSKTNDREKFATQALEIFESEIKGAQTFLIKPNLVSSECCPTTTHPDTLRAVLRLLSPADVVVADAPAIDAGSSDRIIQDSVLRDVCDSFAVPLMNLYKTKASKCVSPRGYRFRMFTMPLERDFVISLPVLKRHNVCGMTGALKNQFGYLPRRERVLMHMGVKDIHKGIAELNVVARPHLFIVDAVSVLVQAQEIRHGGKVQEAGCMLAGTDPVALDIFGLQVLQEVEPDLRDKSLEDIPHIRYAMDFGVGLREFEAVRLDV